MDEPQPKPAGWYPEPGNSSRLRYWDGLNWTGERALIDHDQPAHERFLSAANLEDGASTYAARPPSGANTLNDMQGATPVLGDGVLAAVRGLDGRQRKVTASLAGSLFVLFIVLVSCTGPGGNGPPASDFDADAGAPLPAYVQGELTQIAVKNGYEFEASAETGRCEWFAQIAERLPSSGSGRLTQEQAAAATRAGGSLYTTVDLYTTDPTVLDAVQGCTSYLVGVEYGQG